MFSSSLAFNFFSTATPLPQDLSKPKTRREQLDDLCFQLGQFIGIRTFENEKVQRENTGGVILVAGDTGPIIDGEKERVILEVSAHVKREFKLKISKAFQKDSNRSIYELVNSKNEKTVLSFTGEDLEKAEEQKKEFLIKVIQKLFSDSLHSGKNEGEAIVECQRVFKAMTQECTQELLINHLVFGKMVNNEACPTLQLAARIDSHPCDRQVYTLSRTSDGLILNIKVKDAVAALASGLGVLGKYPSITFSAEWTVNLDKGLLNTTCILTPEAYLRFQEDCERINLEKLDAGDAVKAAKAARFAAAQK